NILYTLGGNTDPNSVSFSPSNDFFYLNISVAFDITNIPWINLSNVVDTPKQGGAAVSAGGPNKNIIFLFGGEVDNSSHGISLVHEYDTTKNVWRTPIIQGIQPPRRAFLRSVTDVTGKMYLFGGTYDNYTGNSTFAFDNRMDILDTIGLTWSKGTELQAPTPRDGFSATLLPNGIIVYLGGNGLNPQNLREITVGTIPEPRAHHSSVLGLNNDRLIIYGGYTGIQYSRSPIVYNLTVLDIRNKPYKWITPNVSGIIPSTPHAHTANVIGRYMIVTYGFLASQNHINPDIYILDIGDDSEYKWVTSFDPNLSPVLSSNSSLDK
ncbi:8625_t:CDS:2, partial [Cetraspora pellucida]